MNPSIAKYKKTLKKNLRCTGDVRNRLLAKFDSTLQLYLEENPSPDELALQAAFGTPEDMAKILMEEVTPSETKHYRIGRTVLKVISGILIAILIALTIFIFFIKQKPVVVNDVIYDNGTISDEDVANRIQEGE